MKLKKEEIFPNITLAKIKYLQGSQRLLRLRVIIECGPITSLESSFDTLLLVVNGILIQKYNSKIEMDRKGFYAKIKEIDESTGQYFYKSDGARIGIDLIVDKKSIDFKYDFYPASLNR